MKSLQPWVYYVSNVNPNPLFVAGHWDDIHYRHLTCILQSQSLPLITISDLASGTTVHVDYAHFAWLAAVIVNSHLRMFLPISAQLDCFCIASYTVYTNRSLNVPGHIEGQALLGILGEQLRAQNESIRWRETRGTVCHKTQHFVVIVIIILIMIEGNGQPIKCSRQRRLCHLSFYSDTCEWAICKGIKRRAVAECEDDRHQTVSNGFLINS